MNILDYITQVSKQLEESDSFYGHGTDNSRDEAAYLVCGTLGISHDHDLRTLNHDLDEEELRTLEVKVEQRIKDKIPTAYLVGEAWFAGLNFSVDKRVLIPRSPLAELIKNRFSPLIKTDPKRVLDLCAGSGCLGVAIAKYFKDSVVDLSDNDDNCIELAKYNVEKHNLSGRITCIQSDLFKNITDRYDLIVSNPPYVSDKEYETLPAEYLHEPRAALVCNDSGLGIPTRILQEAKNYLVKGGILILEVGQSEKNLQERFSHVPFLWLDFENGGGGVLAVTAEQLAEYCNDLN